MKDLQGKTIVITGAAGGIGRALAREAQARGMRLVLTDIAAGPLAGFASELRAQGAEVLDVPVDVTDAAAVEQLAARAYAAFGAVHVVVNNAGLAVIEAAWRMDPARLRRIMDVNFYGVAHGCHAFVPRMLAAGEPGHIVNIASAAGLFTVPGFAAYSASKFAVVGYTEALHHDFATRNAKLSASVVCPSWVSTGICASAPNANDLDAVDDALRRTIEQATAHGIPPEEVATHIFAAIAERRFYVLTHPTTRAAVRVRTEDMLEDRAPTPFVVR